MPHSSAVRRHRKCRKLRRWVMAPLLNCVCVCVCVCVSVYVYVCGVPRGHDGRDKVTAAQRAVSYFYVSFFEIFETEKNK
jgi:hypothetical protein